MSEQYPPTRAFYEHMHYCEQVAKGKVTTKNGRPITELQRFDCRKAVNQRVARRKGATTLYFLLYGLLIDDEISGQIDHPELSGAWMEWQARKLFMATAAADIANKDLIIRDLVHFLRCNDSAEVKQALDSLDQPAFSDFSICVVVTYDDARAWLRRHKRKIPSWLNSTSAFATCDPQTKPLEVTTEKDAELQSLLLGMAVAGYGYLPSEKRGYAVSKIKKAIENATLIKIKRRNETISSHLKRALAKTPFPPSRPDVRSGTLSIVLAMAEKHWEYTGKANPAIFQKISSDLEAKGFFVNTKSIEHLLIEAENVE